MIWPLVSTTATMPRMEAKWATPKARVSSSGSIMGPPLEPTIQKATNTATPAMFPPVASSTSMAQPSVPVTTTAAASMLGMRSASQPKARRLNMPPPAAMEKKLAAHVAE